MKKQYIYLIGLIGLIISFLIDKQIYTIITHFRFPLLTSFMIFLNHTVILFIISTTLIISLAYYRKNKNLILLIISFLFSLLLSEILKYIFMRPRPQLMLIKETSPSFPSNHSTIVFSTVPIINKIFLNFRIIWVIFAFLIAFSRLYLGVHYLSDIIAGSLLGYSISNLVLYLEGKYKILNRYF